jgi:hypothetical protein
VTARVPEGYLPIAAVDVPRIRAGAVEGCTRFGAGFFAACIRAGLMPLRPVGPVDEVAAELAQREIDRLTKADLYYVSQDMTDLTAAAAESLPDFSIAAADIPSRYGFIVFATPVRVVDTPEDHFSDVTYISGASWGPSPIPSPEGGVWISWYSDRVANHATVDPRRGISDEAARQVIHSDGRFAYDNEQNAPFGPTTMVDSLTGEIVDRPQGAWAELKTAWLLMQQPVTTVAEATFDRAERRRLARQRLDDRPVRVINLRRRAASTIAGQSDREYHHQWIVRGHWRDQWYASRGVHRPVWIAPHVKGPEGAPMLGGEKVHAWTG